MMKEVAVELIRRFAPLASRTGHWDYLYSVPGKAQRWYEIQDEWRVLILADPGAGKTFEALARARKIHGLGKKAFFIRIERIDAGFESAFEVGARDEFVAWLASNEEAWFFLDSVDAAQLETPRALENAIRVPRATADSARNPTFPLTAPRPGPPVDERPPTVPDGRIAKPREEPQP